MKCVRNTTMKHGFNTHNGRAHWEHVSTMWKLDIGAITLKVEQAGAFSSNLKHEGTVGRCLWHPDDLSTAEEKQEAETEYLDNLIKEIENGVQLSKERLAALEASQEPEKPPLDVALCEYYDQTFEHLMKAREAMLEMPPSSVPPVGLDEEGEKLIAKAKEYLEDFRTQVCCTIVLKALTGGAEAHEPRGTAREELPSRSVVVLSQVSFSALRVSHSVTAAWGSSAGGEHGSSVSAASMASKALGEAASQESPTAAHAAARNLRHSNREYFDAGCSNQPWPTNVSGA
ncbi:hypothetical protein MRX96_058464 [Rhipicephalus microplus]